MALARGPTVTSRLSNAALVLTDHPRTMRRLFSLTLSLFMLAGCAPASSPLATDASSHDRGYYVYTSGIRGLKVGFLSTRGNVLVHTPESLIEVNALRLERSRPRTTDFNLPRFGAPPELPRTATEYGLWIGYRGGSALGLSEESTLALSVDGRRVEVPSAGEWLVDGLLRGRDKTRNYRIVMVPPVEVGEEEGEFALFTFDRTLAQHIRDAREVRIEVVGTEGAFEALLPPATLGRIQRLFADRYGYSDRSVRG